MSKTNIPNTVVALLWGRSAGRCQFRGCNQEIWRDGMTWVTINKSHIAHIVADSPDGPRGDPIRSPQLATKIENLMLLCQGCHNRIDNKNSWQQWSEQLLLEFKKEHEDRVSHVTSFSSRSATHWIFYTAKIGDRTPIIHKEEAQQAIIKSGFYPVSPDPFTIDQTNLSITDGDPGFWNIYEVELQKRVDNFIDQEFRRSSCKRIALFGIAPIPLLVKFGSTLGQMVEVRVFQLHRDTNSWSWQAGVSTATFNSKRIIVGNASGRVALSISISGLVSESAMNAAIGDNFVHYSLSSSILDPCAIKTDGDLQRFTTAFLEVLTAIVSEQPGTAEISVFVAAPVSVAVEMGRQKLPKAHPKFRMFDFKSGIFSEALTV